MARLETIIDGKIDGLQREIGRAIVLYDKFGNAVERSSAEAVQGSAAVSTAARRTSNSLNNLGRVSGSSGSSVLAFSRIVQDAPFGIIGVGNNITQLVETFGALKRESGSTRVAVKSFFTSLIAPGNLLVLGISAITTAFTIMSLRARSAKESVDSLTGSMSQAKGSALAEASEIQALVEVARKEELSRNARQEAVDRLQNEYPDYLSNINLENINSNKAAEAINKLTTSLLNKAKAEGASSFISKKYAEILELQTKSAIANANTWDFITSSIVNAGNFSQSFFDLYEKGAKRTAEETKSLQSQINAANKEIQKSFEELAKTGGLNDEKGGAGKDLLDGISAGMTKINTEALQVTSTLSDGLLKATEKFGRGLESAIAHAARYAPDQFGSILQTTRTGGLATPTVLPDLSGPEGVMKAVVSDTADQWERQMGRAVSRMTRSFYHSLEGIAAQGELTFQTVFSGIVQSATSSINEIFLGQFSKKLEDVFDNATSNLSTGLQGALAGAGLVGGILSSTGTAGGQIAGGAISGAATGALIGSAIPGIGTVVGGLAGGVVGLLGGIFGSNKKRERIQEQQLEQLKKAVAYTSQVIGKYVAGVGVVENVSLNTYGELTARVKGKDLEFVLSQQQAANARGI